jgi:hypothetical protein
MLLLCVVLRACIKRKNIRIMKTYVILSFRDLLLLLWWVTIIIPSASVAHTVKLAVPNVVHQTYDYQSPNFFLFLSLLSVQRFIKPEKHILWVNDEGRFRRGHWEAWQRRALEGTGVAGIESWEQVMAQMIRNGSILVRLTHFPAHPPGNASTSAPNKAHRSDFMRMQVLLEQGGIYLDTDALALQPLNELQVHDFTLAFDNIVNPDAQAPRRMNNGVLLSAPNAAFLQLWMREYASFNPASFDYDSSVVPFRLAVHYPDLVHVEMSRLSPVSYAFQTALLADALTCGLFLPPSSTQEGALWYPAYSPASQQYSFAQSPPDHYMLRALQRKLVLHLTMSQVRGLCMLRKQLTGPADLAQLPSFLGHVFRVAYWGYDAYDYKALFADSEDKRLQAYRACRNFLGMHTPPDQLSAQEQRLPAYRQQYQALQP